MAVMQASTVLGQNGKYSAIVPDATGAYHSAVLPGLFISPQWLWPGPDQKPNTRAALQAMGLR